MDSPPRNPWPARFDLGIVLKLLVGLAIVLLVLDYGLRYPALLTLAFLLLAVLAVLTLAHIVVTVLRVQYQDRWGPTRSLPAILTRKWTTESGLEVREGGPVQQLEEDLLGEVPSTASLYEHWTFHLAFDMGDREEEFEVPEDLYTSLEEGTQGILTYRGERLLSFLPSEQSPKPEDDPEGPSRWRPGPRLPR